ncbi:MAG: formylglycine-generating enzyme family protein [Candidatus Hydrogenedentes bacterium]|nr:formylglycine-generating enzyme family protein [Candidatus Hydrogenedentota bacterium]
MKAMRAVWVILSVALFGVGYGYAEGPVVSNVRVTTRTDGSGMVDIYYDLYHPQGSACTVTLYLSKDGGASYPYAVTSATGDLGAGVAPGANRHVLWDAEADYPGEHIGRASIQVEATGPGGTGDIIPGEMISIPAGAFQMGDPWNEGYSDERPLHAVYLNAYKIGKYEVTNREYAEILNWAKSRGYLENNGGGTYTGGLIYAYGQPLADTETSSEYSQLMYTEGSFGVRSCFGYGVQLFSMEDHPMVYVSWYGAVCYCNWLSEQQGLQACYDTATWTRYEPVRNGYRLPTEAEWERAAAWDGSKHWRYGMTSDTIDITRANYYESGFANPLGLTSYPYTSPVGWYNGEHPARLSTPGTLTKNARSPVGAYDMSGNVWEWCHDWYSSTYYGLSPYLNPTGPTSGSYRLLRGGSWHADASDCRAAYRGVYSPYYRYYFIGFRLACASD